MIILLIALLVALVILLGVLGYVLTFQPRPRGRADVEIQSGIDVESGRLATRSRHIEEQNTHSQTLMVDDGRTFWQIDLVNGRGIRRSKCFCDRLVLGRFRPGAEPADMLYLDGDGTISQQQCEILAGPKGLAVRNCSRTSMTMVDKQPAARPVPLRPDSVIRMGRSDWRVTGIRPR